MCYAITHAGLRVLADHGRTGAEDERQTASTGLHRAPLDAREAALRQARHDIRVAGWALALCAALGRQRCALRGPRDAVLAPPTRADGEGRVALAPRDLQLPGGRSPHDFLRSDAAGTKIEVERFETVRPDAIVEIEASAGCGVDVIVELDDRQASGAFVRKLERYDHFLAGWSLHARRYGRRLQAVPVVVFVCRDRARARECARSADAVLCACRAYAGEYPHDWEYPGRRQVLFAAERDAHEGLLCAYGIPRLPPAVRTTAALGDPRAGAACAEARQIPDGVEVAGA